MPELPEVETIKNGLLPFVLGRCFSGVDILWDRSVKKPSPRQFIDLITGSCIQNLHRRGKYFIFTLSNGYRLIIHLRMSGTLLLRQPDSAPDAYARVIFHLDNGSQIRFCDVRKLGTIYLVEDELSVIKDMGPEPLHESFTAALLGELLTGRAAPIKAVLCDQKVIAGIGNMYADEILHRTNIHPLKRAGQISDEEVKIMHEAIVDVLTTAIENEGATVSNYLNASGRAGTAQDHFRVAHRYKEACPDCGTQIERIKIRGRGSYYCPVCQPEP